MNRQDEMVYNFRTNFPSIASHMKDYYHSGPFEIIVIMNDGGRFIYNNLRNSMQYLEPIEEKNMSEEEWRMAFSENLKRLIKSRNTSARWLSDVTGISQSTISKVIKGKAFTSAYNIKLIADALQCSVSELYYFN